MSIEKVIKKYIKVIKSDIFVKYEKDFAQRINSALQKGYLQKLDEPKLVLITEMIVNGIHGLNTQENNPDFQLSTKAIFIHGNKSQVKFDYYEEKPCQRELGDLIFIISIIFNGRKYLEKFTISQFKKDSVKSSNISWNISNKEQLYLLSRFPTFTGVSGSIIPMREHTLPNYSGCLGSYGLLYRPGDFAFVSATELDSFLGYKNTLNINELYDLNYESGKHLFPYFHTHADEFLDLLIDRYYRRYGFIGYLTWNLFSNYHHAHNTFDFVHKYLTLGIGEPTFMEIGIDNPQARNFLYELVASIKNRARRKEGLEELLNFANGFFKYGFAGNIGNEDNKGNNDFTENIVTDFEGGGIGIVHTVINLGQ